MYFCKLSILNLYVSNLQLPTPSNSLLGKVNVSEFLDFPQSDVLPSSPSNVSRNVPRRYSEIWLLVSHYWHSGLQEDVWSSWQDCCCKKQLKSGLFDGKWTVFVQFGGHTFVFLHNSSQRNQLISFHHALRLGLDEQEIVNRIRSNQF